MSTPKPDSAEQNHSVRVMCATVGCSNHSRTWRVYFVKIKPGLLAMPSIICDSCHEPPIVTDCEHD